jgi:hypothetical protein
MLLKASPTILRGANRASFVAPFTQTAKESRALYPPWCAAK